MRAGAARHRAGARRHPGVLARGIPRRPADAGVLRLGHQQLRRARSARRAGGHRAAAAARASRCRARSQPDRERFSGVVFKIQANMDPAHRDRVVFVRVCSGHFERGMRLRVQRTGKDFRPNNVVSFLSQRRELLDEAYAGDIIGIPTHGGMQLGDTLTEGETLQFTGLPFFAPEIFRFIEVRQSAARQAAAHRTDAARRRRRDPGVPPRAQHDDAAGCGGQRCSSRWRRTGCKHEYGVEARVSPAPYTCARWVSADDPAKLERFVEGNAGRVALRCGRCAGGADGFQARDESRPGDVAGHPLPRAARARGFGARDCRVVFLLRKPLNRRGAQRKARSRSNRGGTCQESQSTGVPVSVVRKKVIGLRLRF